MMHLRRAGVNRACDRVAQFPFQFVLGHVSIAALQLKGFQAALDAGLAHVQFSDRCLPQRMASLALEPCRFVQRQAASLEPNLHVGDRNY